MGSKVKGRNRKFDWTGALTLTGNQVVGLEKINFYNQSNYAKVKDGVIEWKGMTTGGLQGIVIDLESDEGQLAGRVNDQEIKVDLARIGSKPVVYDMGGLDARLEIYQVEGASGPASISFDYKLSDLSHEENPIFVKVIAKNGHMAWSSPIYIGELQSHSGPLLG